MKFQSLILMSVPHPTNKLHSCYEVTCNGRHCPNFDDPVSTIRLDSHSPRCLLWTLTVDV
jgi:hypothetical protein